METERADGWGTSMTMSEPKIWNIRARERAIRANIKTLERAKCPRTSVALERATQRKHHGRGSNQAG